MDRGDGEGGSKFRVGQGEANWGSKDVGQNLCGFKGMREELKRLGRERFSCRIGLLNVQELTVAKSVETRDLIVGGNVEGKKILGLVETNVRLRKMDWGESMEHEESINVVRGETVGTVAVKD